MRNSITISTLALTTSLLSGCLVQMPGNLDVGEETSSEETEASTTEDETTTGEPEPEPPGIDGDGCQDAVDILVVVDNSGSMGLFQRRLAESIESLLHPLDDAGVDWRLGVTTTDVGNPWCPPASTTPEAGNLQMRACNDHLDDFLFNNGQLDLRDIACNEVCPFVPGKLDPIPTTTHVDPNPAPRPWLERIDGQSNLAADIDPALASLCLIPQGANGCGFEQPLRAMELAIQRASDELSPQYGFIRPDASLLVVIVTDEVDCSHNDLHTSIFESNGLKTFWSDPLAAFPSSAVCWNAGVDCTGDPDSLDCQAVNKNPDGSPGDTVSSSLLSVESFIDLLDSIEDWKRDTDPGADVGMLVVSGLGLDDQLHYTDVSATDPGFQDSFGVGPGCTDDTFPEEFGGGQALPPVRMLEVASHVSSAPLASICAPSYEQRFAGVLDSLIGSCDE